MKKLAIPEHISLKSEILPGISKTEGSKLLLAFTPALVFTVIYWMCQEAPGPRLIVLIGLVIYAFVCYAVFSCPDGGQSIYSYISRWIRFLRSQQNFKYKQRQEVLRIAVYKKDRK